VKDAYYEILAIRCIFCTSSTEILNPNSGIVLVRGVVTPAMCVRSVRRYST